MIRAIEIKNFFSFRDATRFDFTVNAKAGDRDVFAADPADGPDSPVQVNKVMAIFGANASGKTQFLKAIGFLQWFVLHSAQAKPDSELRPTAFLFDPECENQPTDLAMEFSVGEKLYRYELQIHQSVVLREVLKVKKTRWSTVFDRELEDDRYRFTPSTPAYWKDQPDRKNASILSWAYLADENETAKQVGRWFSCIQTNVNHHGRTRQHDPAIDRLLEAAEFFDNNPEQLEWVNERLCHFDLGLGGVVINRVQAVVEGEEKQEIPWPEGVHSVSGSGDRSIPLINESLGTQSLFILLRYLLPVLESGGVAVLDEFEHGLHSHMLPVLVELFLGRHNAKNAQLIFNCHSDHLIHELEKYQMALVAKDDEGVSDIWRADETGVRNQDNLYAKYHAGKLGGVPAF